METPVISGYAQRNNNVTKLNPAFSYTLPDFSGGESEPKSCADCGHYFYTNFEPDEDCANRLLGDLNDGDLLKDDYKESLKWKLEIAFGNYDYCDLEVKEILVKCAEIVIKTYSSDTIC